MIANGNRVIKRGARLWQSCQHCTPPRGDVRWATSVAWRTLWVRCGIKPRRKQRHSGMPRLRAAALRWLVQLRTDPVQKTRAKVVRGGGAHPGIGLLLLATGLPMYPMLSSNLRLLPQSTEFWGNIRVPWCPTFEAWLSKTKPTGEAARSVYKDLRMSTTGPALLRDLQDEQDPSLSIS